MLSAIRSATRGRYYQVAFRSSTDGLLGTPRELAYLTCPFRQARTRAFSTTPSLSIGGTRNLNVVSLDKHSRIGDNGDPLSRIVSARNMSSEPPKKDWSATQYLKFNNERTRAVYDLVAQVKAHITTSNPRIYDLGCGPGNSTKVLLDAFSGATITGMDSSPDMLSKASASLPDIEFVKGDLSTFRPKEGEQVDLLFSNAVFHWLRSPTRIPTLTRLFQTLRPGGVLAIQVPDNYDEESHKLMREVARARGSAWSRCFVDAQIGVRDCGDRPDLDPIEPPRAFYNALIPHAASVNVWRTNYHHVLKDANAIMEWVKGTGLQPYVQRIEDEEAKKAFLEEYEKRLARAYKELDDGKVLLGYPRLFIVAVRQ